MSFMLERSAELSVIIHTIKKINTPTNPCFFSRADVRESMVFYDYVCTDVFTSRLPTRSVQQSKTRAPVLFIYR